MSDERERCSCGVFLSGSGRYDSDSYDAEEYLVCRNKRHSKEAGRD